MRGLERGGSSNTGVGKTVLLHVLWRIDVSEIDDHRARHEVPQSFQIECAELFPLSDDHCGVGFFDAIVWSFVIRHIGKH